MSNSHSPLAQFEVHPIIPLQLGGFDISFTNASLWMVAVICSASLLLYVGASRRQLVPGRWQTGTEMIADFVGSMLTDNAGKEGMKYFSFIFTLFMFVLFGNLLGMIPGSFTITSHIIVTFALAGFVFLAITAIGFARHGLRFFSLFLPEGTPWLLIPMLVPIEIISYLARPCSLAIRLAANMLAGHLLMKIVGGFVMIGLWGIFPFAFLLLFTGFEIFIACLQAYIFAMLSCIYLNDALNLH